MMVAMIMVTFLIKMMVMVVILILMICLAENMVAVITKVVDLIVLVTMKSVLVVIKVILMLILILTEIMMTVMMLIVQEYYVLLLKIFVIQASKYVTHLSKRNFRSNHHSMESNSTEALKIQKSFIIDIDVSIVQISLVEQCGCLKMFLLCGIYQLLQYLFLVAFSFNKKATQRIGFAI